MKDIEKALEELGKAYFIENGNKFLVKGQKPYNTIKQALTKLKNIESVVNSDKPMSNRLALIKELLNNE